MYMKIARISSSAWIDVNAHVISDLVVIMEPVIYLRLYFGAFKNNVYDVGTYMRCGTECCCLWLCAQIIMQVSYSCVPDNSSVRACALRHDVNTVKDMVVVVNNVKQNFGVLNLSHVYNCLLCS